MLPSQEPKEGFSKTFLITISAIIGIVVGGAGIVGVLGSAFYVDRSEYTRDKIQAVGEKSDMAKTLDRLASSIAQQSAVMVRQEERLERVQESVQQIKLDLARKR
jgi:mannose-1-phosphate guanylyltransferase